MESFDKKKNLHIQQRTLRYWVLEIFSAYIRPGKSPTRDFEIEYEFGSRTSNKDDLTSFGWL